MFSRTVLAQGDDATEGQLAAGHGTLPKKRLRQKIPGKPPRRASSYWKVRSTRDSTRWQKVSTVVTW